MVFKITRIVLPLVGVAVIGLILREAYATSLGQAGSSAGGFGRGLGDALGGIGSGIGSIPANILGGFGSGLTSLSSGIGSFLNLFGGISSPSPAVESGSTNPTIRVRQTGTVNPTPTTTAGVNNSALSYRQRMGF